MWLAFGSQMRELRNGEVTVGSGAEADWRIPDADLKPRHFVLTIYDLNASLKPASKENVVVVNGAQVTADLPRLLNDGDVVLAGAARFLFSETEARADEEAWSVDCGPAYLVDERRHVAHSLRNRSVGIGRDGSNAIVVPDPTVSRFHAEVRREAGGFALHAMGTGGTTVNGQRVDGAYLLGDEDVVRVGSMELRFSRSSPGAATDNSREEATPAPARTSQPTQIRRRVERQERRARLRHGPLLWIAIVVSLIALLSWFLR